MAYVKMKVWNSMNSKIEIYFPFCGKKNKQTNRGYVSGRTIMFFYIWFNFGLIQRNNNSSQCRKI